jgi:hypothetical protein
VGAKELAYILELTGVLKAFRGEFGEFVDKHPLEYALVRSVQVG